MGVSRMHHRHGKSNHLEVDKVRLYCWWFRDYQQGCGVSYLVCVAGSRKSVEQVCGVSYLVCAASLVKSVQQD